MKQRKSPRLHYFNYASPGAYFITLVCQNRWSLFGEIHNDKLSISSLGQIASDAWYTLPERVPGLHLDVFTIMPNHLHGILWLNETTSLSLLQVINLYKGGVTRMAGRRMWQRSFYDRVIRNADELAAIRDYIRNNPAQWTLDRLHQH